MSTPQSQLNFSGAVDLHGWKRRGDKYVPPTTQEQERLPDGVYDESGALLGYKPQSLGTPTPSPVATSPSDTSANPTALKAFGERLVRKPVNDVIETGYDIKDEPLEAPARIGERVRSYLPRTEKPHYAHAQGGRSPQPQSGTPDFSGAVALDDQAAMESVAAQAKQRMEGVGQQYRQAKAQKRGLNFDGAVVLDQSQSSSTQPSIVDALSNETTKVQRTTNRMMRKLPQPSTPRSLAGTTTTPMRRRDDLTTGSVPNLQDIVTSARENPDPNAENTNRIRAQVVKERYPTTAKGMIGRNIQRVTGVLNPYQFGEDLTKLDETIIGEEVNRRLAAQERATTPEMIAARKKFGALDPVTRAASSIPATLFSDVLKGGAGVIDLGEVSGLPTLARAVGIPVDKAKDWLNAKGNFFKEVQSNPALNQAGEEIQRSLPEKVGTQLGEMGVGIGELLLLKRATGLSMSKLMALETGAKTSDLPVRERAAKVAESAAMGRILDGHLSRSASAALFGIPTAVQGGTSYLQGNTSGTDALINTAVQAGAGAILGGKPKAATETTLTKVPDIETTLRAREAGVKPYAQAKDIEVATEPTKPAVGVDINPEQHPGAGLPLEQGRDSGAPHHSEGQNRRVRNTATGKRGQFAKGSKLEQKGAPPNDVVPSTLADEANTVSTKATEGVGELAPSESSIPKQPPVSPSSPSTSVPAVEQSTAPVSEKQVEGWHFSRTAAEAQKILKEGFNPKFQSKDAEYPDPANGVWIGTGEPEYLDRIPGMKERGLSLSAKLRPIKFETPQDLYDFVDPLVGRKLGNVHVSEVSRLDPLLKPVNRQKVSDALLAKGYNAIEIGEGFRGASPHRPGDYLIIDPSLAKDVRPYEQDVTPTLDRRIDTRIPAADWSTMTPAEQARTRQQLEIEMGGPATHEGGVRIGAKDAQVEPDTKPSVTSARKADLASDRAELDLPELPQAERKGWQTSLDNAKSRGLDQQANRLADEVLKSPRALNDEETAGMVLRLQQVKNEHAGLLKQVGEGDAETQAATRARLQTVEDEFDKLDTATKKSGTEKGRTLAAQKLTINQDFDLISLIQRAKARGIEITPSRRQKYADMVAKVGDLEAQLAKAREDNATKSVQQQIDSVRRKSNRQVRKGEIVEQREAIKQSITAEITRLKEQSAQGQFLSQGGLGNLDPEGVITKNLVKYAKTLIDEGVLKAEDVIDRVHELVKDYGATRRQTAEALSGYGIGDNKAKLESELARIRREIRETLGQQDVETGRLTSRRAGPRQSEAAQSGQPRQGPRLSDINKVPLQGPRQSEANRLPAQGPRITDAPFVGPRTSDVNRVRAEGPNIASKGQNEIRVRQLEKQAREIEQKIANKDYSPTVKREPVIYDAKSNRIQSQVEALKRQYQADLDANEKKSIGDYLVRWKRFAVLTYPTTFGKLATAAASRMSLSPVEELSDLALSRAPGFKQVARQSSMGQPSMKAEAKAIRQIWEGGETNGFKQTLEYLKTGHDMLDLLYGGKHADEFRSGDKILGAPGRAHGAVKEIPKRAAFYRSFEKRLALAEKQGADIADPRVQLAKAGEAYVDAQRAVLQQDNPVSKAFSQWVGGMERSKSGTMQAAGKALRFTFPITRVPVNFAGEAAMNIAGVPYAAVRTGIRAMQGKLNDLSPTEADHIRRAYKIGGVGAAFLTWGILKPDQFGGYYQPGKRDESDLKAGEMKLFGQRLPRWLAHTPQLEAAQFGATIRRTFDKLRAKHPETSKTEAGIVGTATAAKGLGEEIPFVQPLLDSERGLGSLFTHPGKFAANQIKGAIPGAVQWGARRLDTDTGNPVTGTTIPRPTSGFVDTLQEGIPGLRQRIEPKETKGGRPTRPTRQSTPRPKRTALQRMGIFRPMDA